MMIGKLDLNNNPLVSICVPVYNGGEYLSETLQSIASQTYSNIEVIICDNNSSDNTFQIAQKLSSIKDNWKAIKNETNIGPFENLNKVMENASGDLIAIYHADDVYDKFIVEESVKGFLRHPEVGYVSTLGCQIDSNGNDIRTFNLPKVINDLDKEVYNIEDVFLGLITVEPSRNEIMFITPSVMVKKEVYESVGIYDSCFKSACDYEMWFRISEQYPMHIITQKLISYRKHKAQGSQSVIRDNTELPDHLMVTEKYIKEIQNINVKKAYRKFLDKTFIMMAIKKNNAGQFKESSIVLSRTETLKGKIVSRIIKLMNFISLRIKWDSAKVIYRKLYAKL